MPLTHYQLPLLMQILPTWDDILSSMSRFELHSIRKTQIYWRGYGAGAHEVQGKAERDGFLQAGEHQQILLLCIAAQRRWSQTLSWGLQWHDKRQQTSWNMRSSDYTQVFFNTKRERILRQTAQRGCGISMLKDNKNLTDKALSKVIKPDLFWAELNTMTSLPTSIILGT